MGTTIHWVDAFTERPFAGNPAAVCLPAAAPPDAWMQALAAEIGLSETAFATPREDGFDLRWFTPAAEVDLCGHATLATAHALWETGRAPAGSAVRFHTRSGVLGARPAGERIELDFPADPPRESRPPAGLAGALGVTPRWVGRTVQDDWLVEVVDEAAVRGLAPDLDALAAVPARGIMVTAAGADGYDFVSRFFAPRVGVPEDPVTGSAHCALGPFWAARIGRAEMVAFQASRRGGVVHVRVEGERVALTGRAVTVLSGTLRIGEEEPDG